MSAHAYWTDGCKEHSLMAGGGGLRKCKCGQYFLLREAIQLEVDPIPDTPAAQYVGAADLANAVSSPRKAVELVARRQYWMHLNDPYRESYRAHRKAEDLAALEKWNAAWYKANPDLRSLWRKVADRLFQKKREVPPPMDTRPFSVPSFKPTQLQIDNMQRLLALILEKTNETYGPDYLEVAELYRELGRFTEAKNALAKCPKDDKGVSDTVIEGLIAQGQTAPVRYRM